MFKLSAIYALLTAASFRLHMSDESLLDLDSVLGASLDGVENAPEFVTPPEGSYVLTIHEAKAEEYKTTDPETKNEVKKVRLKVIYKVVETKELADPEEQPVVAGALFSEQFMTNENGLSFFKRQAKNVLGEENIAGVPIGDVLKELSNNYIFNADVRVKTTKGKGDNVGKVFSNVQVRIKPTQQAELSQ